MSAGMLGENFVVEGTDEPEVPNGPEPSEPAPAPETPKEPSAPVPIGRRAAARERQNELLGELKTLRESITKQGETYAERLARLQEENAEIRGTLQGYISRPQEPPKPAEKLPDPQDLHRQARKALDDRDFDEYQRLYGAAIKAEVMHEMAPRFQQQAPQTPAVNPLLQMVASQYTDVMTDRAAFEIAQAHDRILAAQRVPEGPDRWKKAFEEGRRFMAAKNPRPQQHSTRQREVLQGSPTQRTQSNDGGGQLGVRLNDSERAMAKKFKMSEEQYANQLAAMHPERVERE